LRLRQWAVKSSSLPALQQGVAAHFSDRALAERHFLAALALAPDALPDNWLRRREADHRDAARDNGFVDVVDAVGGQEQQAVEVFEHAQEDTDDGVHRDVVVAFLDVNVGFVDQHHPPSAGARVSTSFNTVSITATFSPSWPECTRHKGRLMISE
jgi:hypothetical protein